MNDSLTAGPGANVIFIDSRVKDPQALLEGVAPDTQVVYLDGAADGLAQMAAYLAEHPGAASVHVVAHGAAGDLWLGSSYLDAAALQAQAALLGEIGASLAPDGDILLYSCNLAAGEAGAAFVDSLAALTGADVAASDDRTGAGGDWQLEITRGEVTAAAPFADLALDEYGMGLATFTVTTNADSGAGSLRQHIIDAVNGDTITFNASMTVSLSTVTSGNMLSINENLTIDGDLNNDGTPDVTLDAQNKGRVLAITSGTVTLDGLVLTKGLLSGNGGGFGGLNGSDALGAGLSVSGAGTKVTVLGSTITANAASGGGGGGSGNGYSYGGGGGGGRSSVGGGNGGAYDGSTSGATGSNGIGGKGGYSTTFAQAGNGGSTTGGTGGSAASGFAAGGAGATAGPGGGSSIGGGGGGAGASGGLTSGGNGGNTAGGIFVNSGATVYMARSTVSGNWGAGGGGGGGYSTAGGAGGDGAGAVRVVGTFKYQSSSMTFANNRGVGATGGSSNSSSAGANGNSTNDVRTAGGTVDSNWTPPNTAPTLGTVTANAVGQGNAGQNSYSFTVVYSDSDGTIDNTTIDTNDVTVAKGGTNLVISNASWNAGTSTATYTVTPDGSTWDDADNGTWTIAVVANQVADDGGAFVAANASAGSFSVSMDTTGPTVSSVSSSSSNGSYKAGDTVAITVQFTESVTVTGTPTLALNTGGAAAYASGSGSNTLTFNYTIQGGENASDLDYAATNSLSLSGGTIRDAASNNATLTLPAVGGGSSLGGQKNIVVDTAAPTVSSVSASTANGTYKVGDTIAVTVTFAESVTVTGTPTLALNSGGTASYASGSGTNTLTFNYTVGAGDSAADLDYSATNSLALSGGTIRDAVGNDATLTLPTVGGGSSLGGQKNLVIDGIAPALSSDTVPANGTYIAGQNLDFTVTYAEAVTVNTGGGTPYIALTLDTGGSVQAAYLSGSGTTTLTFRYTVASGNADANGVAAASSITLNGGTLRDAAGNNAATTGISFASTAAVLVEAVAPTVSSINRVSSATTNATSVDYTVTFSETVSGVDTSDFTLTATGTAAGSIASVAQVNGSTYTVTVNTISGDGTLRLDLKNAGTGIADTPGNAITTGYTAGQTYTIDNTAPGVTSVGVPANATYIAGQNLDFTVNFGEAVTVNTGGGTPRIALTLDTGGTVYANYLSGSGTSALVFRHTVASGTADANGIAVAGSIDANGGTLRDSAGNNATPTLNSVGSTASVLVDAIAPTVSSVSVPANATYIAGQNLNFIVNFSENVTVNTGGGTPRIALTLDTGTVYANYLAGSGTTALVFRYTVASGSLDSDGVTLASSISANGGTLRDGTGNDATLTLNSVGSTTAVLVEAVAPTVSSINRVSSATTNATSVDYTVAFSENVSGVDTSDFTLTTTGTATGSIASIAQVSASTYTVTVNTISGDGTLRLDLKNAGTGIADTPGNAIALGYTSGQTYTIDNTAPAVTSVGVPASATYSAGQNLDFTVNFDQAVTVNTGGGTPRIALTLDTGGTVYASYLSGSGTSALVFRHTIASGTADANGIAVVGSIDANGGTLRDSAGNNATLTLNSVGSTAAVLVDAVRPTASIVLADTALAAGETPLVTITFSEAITGFTKADLTVANGTISAVSSSDGGITWTATLTPDVGVTDASNLVTLDNTGVVDAAGNTGIGTTDSNNYAIDTARPTATVVLADNALTGGETSLVTITFSEAVTGFTKADLTVPNGSLSGVSSSDGGITWTATFTPTASVLDPTNVITLDNTGVTDAAGNAGTGTTDSANFSIDTTDATAPVFASASASGGMLVLSYTDANNLDAVNVPAPGAFTVLRGSTAVGVTGVTVSAAAKTVTLSLATPVQFGDSLTVAYADPSAGNDANAIQDANGNDAASLTATAVTNTVPDTAPPTLVSASVNGTLMTLLYADNDRLDPTKPPVPGAFSVTVGGEPVAVLSLSMGIGSIALTLAQPARAGQVVSVSYTDPSAGNDTAAVQDRAGNDAASFTGVIAANDSPPELTANLSVSDNLLGAGETATVTITFSNPVSGFDLGDLVAGAGSLGGLASIDNLRWTATLTPAANTSSAGHAVTLNLGGVAPVSGEVRPGQVLSNTYAVDTVAPTLDAAASTPAAGATRVAVNTPLLLQFSEALSAASNLSGVVLRGNGSTVAASVAIDASGRLAITPQAALAFDTEYTLSWTANALRDAAGNAAAAGTGHAFRTALDPATRTSSGLVDGVTVETRNTPTPGGGSTTVLDIAPTTATRRDDPATQNPTLADIPLVPAPNAGEAPLLALSLPLGTGARVEGRSGGTLGLREQLVQASTQRIADGGALNQVISNGIDTFMPTVADEREVTLRVLELRSATAPGGGSAPIVITGATGRGEGSLPHPDRQEALVIDATRLPAGSVLQLDNVEFSIVVGNVRIIGGSGANSVVGDGQAQTIVLGADDDLLRGGGGDDTVASKGGNDRLYGDDGDDLVVGGAGDDMLEGGRGNDVLQGGASDAGRWTFQLAQDGTLRSRYIAKDAALTDVPNFEVTGPWGLPEQAGTGDARIQFSFQPTERLATVASLHQAVLDRLPTLAELNLYSTLPADTLQLSQLAFDAFRAAHAGLDTAPVATQVRTLIQAVWGSGAETEALVPAGVQFIGQGGSWAEGLLYLANAPRGRAAIIDAQGLLNLAQAYTSSELGWGAGSGADVLRGGEGNDRLVGGGGNDLLDGGAGTDRAVFTGRPADLTVHAARVDGVPALVVSGRHGGDVDTLISIEQWEIGDKVYAPTAAMANLVPGQEYELAGLLVELIGVAPG